MKTVNNLKQQIYIYIQMKQYLLMAILSSFFTHIAAQDVIVKRDGSTILSKVLEVNTSDIKYKKFSNPKGPTYTINKSEIMSINYENGDKDDFNNIAKKDNIQESVGQGLVKKTADANNENIIKRHNVIHPNFDGKTASSKACTDCTVKFGIKSSSIVSNEDIEIEFVRKLATGYDYSDELLYFISIKNKTDKVLYIDKGNCFRVYNDGYSYCYFDASTQTTVNNGGASGASVNLGSLAGAFGIGGVIGQVAGGVNVGGGTSNSVSTTYASQRFIAIPPHGNKFLSEYKWVGEGKRRTCVEEPEFFNWLWLSEGNHEFKSTVEIGLKRGIVNKNGTKVFGENELPWKREYFVTYSTDDTFRSYSALHAELYIQEIIGDQKDFLSNALMKLHKNGNWFLNENTIVSGVFLDKK